MSALPKGWTREPLAKLGTWTGGGTPSTSNAEFWTNGAIPWVSPKDMKQRRITTAQDSITEAAVRASTTNLIPEDSVMLVTRSGILRHSLPVATNTQPVTLNQDMKALTPLEALLPDYLYFAFRRYERDILHGCCKGGTTVQSIEAPRLMAFEIPVPPLAEQRRIVGKVEELFSELDEGVANLKQARAQLAVYRQALLKHAFEGHLTADWRTKHASELESASQLLARIRVERQQHAEQIKRKRFQEPIAPDTTGLSELPKNWQWASLDQVFIVERGRFSIRPRNDPRYYGGDMPFVQIGDLPREGGPINAYHQSLNEAGVGVSKAFPSGTVLIAIVGATIGNTGILSFESCCPDSLVALQSSSPALLRYADAFLQSRKLSLRAAASASGGQPNINLNLLQPMAIPLPPEKEVEALLDALDSQLTNITALEADIDLNLQKAEALRQSILKKAFSGELVPQDPADEPAAALLARIRAEREAQAADNPKKKPSRLQKGAS